MRPINYYELGATLYMPMNHVDVMDILRRKKLPGLKSIVLCLEDAVSEEDLPMAMEKLENEILSNFVLSDLKVFIRPRNLENLKIVLSMKRIQFIDGFALPKFDTNNITRYLSLFINENTFYILPILETKDVFSGVSLSKIMSELEPFREHVLCVRVGSEDILSLLNMMRSCDKTIYEIMPLYIVLSTILNLFKSHGFNVSSPVYGCYERMNILEKELLGDIEHGIFNKTTIHPCQIETIHDSYKVTQDEFEVATKLLTSSLSVFGHGGRMYEKKTHSNWAKNILERKKYYGVKNGK